MLGTDYIKQWTPSFASLYNIWPLTMLASTPPLSITSTKSSQALKQTFTRQEYENILKHINNYVQQLVEIKVQQQLQQHQQQPAKTLTSQQIQLIVQIIKENLQHLQQQQQQLKEENSLNPDNLVDLVVTKLQASTSFQKPLQLSAQHVQNIKNLIDKGLQTNLQDYKKLINVDALVERILKSSLFQQHLNEHINQEITNLKLPTLANDIKQYTIFLNNLQQQVDLVKLSLNERNSQDDVVKRALNKLQQSHEDLLKRLEQQAVLTDERFSSVLQEISAKLLALKHEQFSLLNQQIKLNLLEILGFHKDHLSAAATLTAEDVKEWLHQLFVAKDYLEERLLQINNHTNNRLQQEINRSSAVLMRDIGEQLKQQVLNLIVQKQNENNALLAGQLKGSLTEDKVKGIVKSVLAVYDADKTGLVDFALESAGGQILSTRCTESYQARSAQISIFGIPLWYPTNTPRIAISPNVQPGECWAFQGFPGFLVLKLNSMVYVTGFTLEHIPKTLTPNGRIDSAPRNFTVWGLEDEKDPDPVLFGEYEYKEDGAATLQYFSIQNVNIQRPFEIVELRIESNHGHPLYTCLYRFRVHGKPTTST